MGAWRMAHPRTLHCVSARPATRSGAGTGVYHHFAHRRIARLCALPIAARLLSRISELRIAHREWRIAHSASHIAHRAWRITRRASASRIARQPRASRISTS
jgi:hypothetical protein